MTTTSYGFSSESRSLLPTVQMSPWVRVFFSPLIVVITLPPRSSITARADIGTSRASPRPMIRSRTTSRRSSVRNCNTKGVLPISPGTMTSYFGEGRSSGDFVAGAGCAWPTIEEKSKVAAKRTRGEAPAP